MECGTKMGEKEPLEDKSETHGLCDKCLKIQLRIEAFNNAYLHKPLLIRG